MSLRSVNLGSFSPGVNNRVGPTQLRTVLSDNRTATYLYAADNVDLSDMGRARRRRGFTRSNAAAGCHSLWSDDRGAYGVMAGNLVALEPSPTGLTPTVLRGDMPLRYTSFARAPDGNVYWSNGIDIGRIADGVAGPLVTASPAAVPSVTLIAGALPPGRYQFAFTVLGTAGESASTTPVAVTLPAAGGIQLGAMQAGTQVYMTGPNGSVFNRTDGSTAIVALANNGAPCPTLLLAEMPAGQIVREHLGSLLSAAGAVLYISEPYYYGLCNPSRGFIPFPAPITVVEPCETGVFVCADKTYWLPGALDATKPEVVAPYGGLLGSGGSNPTTEQVYWQSPRGLVLGSPTGKVSAVQDEVLSFGASPNGASLYREVDGQSHFVTSRFAALPAVLAAQHYLTAETTRKENTP